MLLGPRRPTCHWKKGYRLCDSRIWVWAWQLKNWIYCLDFELVISRQRSAAMQGIHPIYTFFPFCEYWGVLQPNTKALPNQKEDTCFLRHFAGRKSTEVNVHVVDLIFLMFDGTSHTAMDKFNAKSPQKCPPICFWIMCINRRKHKSSFSQPVWIAELIP